MSAIMKPCERVINHVEINASRTFLSPFTKGTRALVFVIRLVSFSGPNGHHKKKNLITIPRQDYLTIAVAGNCVPKTIETRKVIIGLDTFITLV